MTMKNGLASAIIAGVLSLGGFHSTPLSAQGPGASSGPTLNQAGIDQYKILPDYEDIKRSVVRILVDMGHNGPTHNGTGFLISRDVVATNDHVSQRRGTVRVVYMLGNEPAYAEADVIGTSERADLALFRTRTPIPIRPLPLAGFGPPVGAQVGAAGYPGTIDHILTSPTKFASLTGGNVNQVEGSSILHSASLSPGNSGGPLFLRTECGSVVVGVNTHIVFTSKESPLYYAAYGSAGLAALARQFNVAVQTIDDVDFCDRARNARETDAPRSATPPPPPPRRPPLPTAEIERRLQRAEAHIKQGEIIAARRLLEHACESGDARALTLMGDTYNPIFLRYWGVMGLIGDPQKAGEYYARADQIQIRPQSAQSAPALERREGRQVGAGPSGPPQIIPLDADMIIKRAVEALAIGDVIGARVFLEIVAGSDHPRGLHLLAETYDPRRLAEWKLIDGPPAEPARARHLYERAFRLGLREAGERLRQWP